jgi:uncharacterized membrane protein YdjX (TVP38/TMEM64 family)
MTKDFQSLLALIICAVAGGCLFGAAVGWLIAGGLLFVDSLAETIGGN